METAVHRVRLELRLMFDAILEQIEKFELARPADVRSPIWSWAPVRQAEPVRTSLHKC
jgi:hypothetical protein